MAARSGPIPRYGERRPCKVHWPAEHRDVYEREAAKQGLTLGEYLIRVAATAHGIPVPDRPSPEGEQLPLSA
ncbi:MAG: hypothetical protein ACRD0H_25190 [Actinomycetes bacterium]